MKRWICFLYAMALAALCATVARADVGMDAFDRKDYAAALTIWQPLADQGNAEAQYGMGLLYDDGLAVPRDDARAVFWYRKAAVQGYADAQYNLGVAYDEGDGIPANPAKAVEWYRLAAEQGDADAQFNLGVAYDDGEGVAEDKAEAAKWYRKAAEQGDADAQYSLGYLYQNGEGVEEGGRKRCDRMVSPRCTARRRGLARGAEGTRRSSVTANHAAKVDFRQLPC
ncbi:MAG TPA: tetratricopeptide repeat protein [Mesorhizobium sp.]